jgi:hypothetical protein
MATPVQQPTAEVPSDTRRSARGTVVRLALRWSFIVGVTVLAFHQSLLSLLETTRAGGLNGYVWMVPIAAVMGAVGVARQERTELPIHDRQTDIIVGLMGLVLALMVHGVLLHRYSMYFHLLRLDLVAMWLFVASAAVMLFGLRPVIRFHWVWVLLSAVFTLPYHVAVILLGGGRFAAGFVTLTIASAATGIAVGTNTARGWRGNAAAWAAGMAVLAVMAVFFPNSPLLAYQMVPALTSVALVSVAMFVISHRGLPKRLLNRKVEPLAAKQVWAALPVVLAVGIVLSFMQLPGGMLGPSAKIDGATFGRPLTAPAGWHVTETVEYPFVRRIYGSDARLIRQRMVADVGDPRWDKFARPRTVVVDTTTTWRPFSLNVYPARLLYDFSDRLSDPYPVELGNGVRGIAMTAVDDDLLLTWNILQFVWRTKGSAQRVLIATVDNHEPGAPFPEPNGGIGATLGTMVTVLFRGNAAATDLDPTFKDAGLLTEFGRDLVETQLAGFRSSERGVPS